jgi:8-oxo-dGTP diphosphatase
MEFIDYDTRLGAYAVIVRDGHVLLALWDEPEVPILMWSLPGGGVELHETPAEGAIREVREETGYDVELTGLLGVETFVMPPEKRFERVGDRHQKNVQVVYAATVVGGELTHEVGGSTSEARWIPIAEVPTLERIGLIEKFVG